jgi:MFS family permease
MLPGLTRAQRAAKNASPALKFVLMVGIMSFFADFTYEGSRSIAGPYLGLLGAGAFTISVISGAGEFIGYNIRLFSGRRADRTGRYWPITIGGYVLQMSVVPLLALAGSWQVAALLIIAERIGKGIRNPPRDAMLSHAAKDIGYGWAFGVHEALDQFGALFGPLLIALVLAVSHHDYKVAFASLAIPAVIMLSLLGVARLLYPRPQDLAAGPAAGPGGGLPRVLWIYVGGAALAAAGFADAGLSGERAARVPGCAVITSHDRWFLDRVATHILAWEDEADWSWFEGNFAAYEQDKAARLGKEAARPHRIAYRRLTR